jgi:16S rRNA (guanine527-N7)-methyltransferase
VLKQILQKGLDKLQLKLSAQVQQKLIDYVLLLHKWNQTYNLTAIRDPKEIVIRHILDSLAIVPYIKGKRILDVGSGAGLPGIPLALALPKKHFVLLDSNSKKIRFLVYAVSVLKITNVEIVQERVEKYQSKQKFASIITRAFASLEDTLNKTRHLYNKNGYLLAMKGKYPKQELQKITLPILVYKIEVPNLDEQRHLVLVRPV